MQIDAAETQKQRGDILMDDHIPPKVRISSLQPIVLDVFETEAKQEVLASGKLNTDGDHETRVEIKHQVRIFRLHANLF